MHLSSQVGNVLLAGLALDAIAGALFLGASSARILALYSLAITGHRTALNLQTIQMVHFLLGYEDNKCTSSDSLGRPPMLPGSIDNALECTIPTRDEVVTDSE